MPSDYSPEPAARFLWHNDGPQLYIRLIPDQPVSDLGFKQALDTLRLAGLHPPGISGSYSAVWNERNEYGAIILESIPASDHCIARTLTQLFTTGEMWGINAVALHPDRNPNKVIPLLRLQRLFENALDSYLSCAFNHLGCVPPLVYELGINNVLGFPATQLDDPYEPTRGRCLKDEVILRESLEDISMRYIRKSWMG